MLKLSRDYTLFYTNWRVLIQNTHFFMVGYCCCCAEWYNFLKIAISHIFYIVFIDQHELSWINWMILLNVNLNSTNIFLHLQYQVLSYISEKLYFRSSLWFSAEAKTSPFTKCSKHWSFFFTDLTHFSLILTLYITEGKWYTPFEQGPYHNDYSFL